MGHNPIARIGVTLLLLLLFVQLATGLVIAGTDLFWPPFGHWFAQWVAAPGVDPAIVQPGAVDVIDKASYQAMRALRGPFVEVHEVTFYALALLIALHLIAVVLTELLGLGMLRTGAAGRAMTSSCFDAYELKRWCPSCGAAGRRRPP